MRREVEEGNTMLDAVFLEFVGVMKGVVVTEEECKEVWNFLGYQVTRDHERSLGTEWDTDE